ncbi:hypothetical protein D210916BOD24_08130 [Alteromonas sp. D210916BOD_24]|uniref:FAD-binding oxidoreductase n=1 Tax=Alteromonas sp. D210916BOD_24 TaxID=3157618 RepID=UPI00399C96B5
MSVNIVERIKLLLGNRANIIKESPITQGTEGFEQKILCQIKVRDTESIGLILKLANEVAADPDYAFSIHPISTGQNWGYGSATPNKSDKPIVVLDLKGLNAIIDFDPASGLCTLQPGVTQQQLYDYLQENELPFMVPVTGAGPTCSLLSNALERGYGITPIADHFSALTQLKGYLPTGDFYSSSLNCMDQSQEKWVDKAYKWKHGPYLDGLFTQSGNMIVTEATLSLARKPQGFDSFYLRFYGEDSFKNAYDCTQQLFKQLGGVVGGINVMDKTRVMAMVAENPQDKSLHKVMTDEQKARLSDEHDIPEWTVVGTLYGSQSIVKAAKREVRTISKPLADKCFFANSPIIHLARWICEHSSFSMLAPVKRQLDSLTAATEIMLGKPNQIALPLAYWRNPHVPPSQTSVLNPARDNCGLLWYAPLIPATIHAMQDFVAMVRSIAPKYNIEPLITFTHASAFNIDSTVPLLFDLTNPDAKEDAHACLNALFEAGIKKGFVPYRLNLKQQEQLDADAVFWQTAGKVASALDPNQVLSPARYNPVLPRI